MENKILEEFTGLTLKMITCINPSVIYVCIFFLLFCFVIYLFVVVVALTYAYR